MPYISNKYNTTEEYLFFSFAFDVKSIDTCLLMVNSKKTATSYR